MPHDFATELQITAPVSGAQSRNSYQDALRFRARSGRRVRAAPAGTAGAPHASASAKSTPESFPISFPKPRRFAKRNGPSRPFRADLQDRRVEITGPVDRKMVINALNSGANVFMADFEDANSPTWHNNIDGQINLRDAVNRTIEFTSPEGKRYKLNDKIATLLVRPARLASEREARAAGRAADLRLAVRFRPVLLPQRQAADGKRLRARISICRSWKAIWKRACGTTFSTSRRTRWACRAEPSARRC